MSSTPGTIRPTGQPSPLGWSETRWQGLAARLGLTRRELQIVRGILDDRKESSIATRLGISAHTVHTYVVRLYLKLAVSSRMELAMRVLHEGDSLPS